MWAAYAGCDPALRHPWEYSVRSLKPGLYSAGLGMWPFSQDDHFGSLPTPPLATTMNSKLNNKQRGRRRFARSRSATPTTAGMKRHTSGASSISLKQQKKQDIIKKKRRLAAAKRWDNIHNLAELHQRHAKIALDTERIVRGVGQYVEDLPSSSISPPSAPNESPFSHITHDIGAQIELSKQLTTFYPHSPNPIPNRNPSKIGRAHV